MTTLRKYWFTVGLLAVAVAVIGDPSATVAVAGQWLGRHSGAQLCVMAMFLLSGLGLDAEQARRGIADIRTLLVALAVVFVVAPLLALAHTVLPLEPGLRIGLVLIAVMPTTLSSGVVMTAIAGGNPASALMVTLTASWLAIFTIPLSLELLLGSGGELAAGTFDNVALAIRLGVLVVAPLLAGMALRKGLTAAGVAISRRVGGISQWLVLTVVWIAMSRSHETLQQTPSLAAWSVVLATSFHGLLFLAATASAKLAGLRHGRREVVWFMGAQKTLPIAVLLQTSLFPEYGAALVFCVVHHVVHLATDSFVATRIGTWRKG